MAQRKKYFPPLPAWGGPFEKWARNYVNKNHWRAAHVFGSEEDSLQECAAVFARCLRTYEGKVDNPAWFMSLFKISVINEWNTVSIKDAHQREMYDADADADYDGRPAQDMGSDNWGYITATLRSTGAELLSVLQTIASTPADALAVLFGAPTVEQQRAQIRRHKGLHDEFSVECIRLYIEKLQGRNPAEAAEAFAALQDLVNGLKESGG